MITCNIPSLSDYPEWRGPPETNGVLKLYNLDRDFFTSLPNYARLSWGGNKKDLVLGNAVRGDEGMYSCSNFVNKWTVQLNMRGRIL